MNGSGSRWMTVVVGRVEDYLTGAASVSGVFPFSTKSGRDEQTGIQDDSTAR